MPSDWAFGAGGEGGLASACRPCRLGAVGGVDGVRLGGPLPRCPHCLGIAESALHGEGASVEVVESEMVAVCGGLVRL